MTRTRGAAGRLLGFTFCHAVFKVRLSTAAFDCDQNSCLATPSDRDKGCQLLQQTAERKSKVVTDEQQGYINQ